MSPNVLSNTYVPPLIEATTTAATTTASATTTLAPGTCTYDGVTIGPFTDGSVSYKDGVGTCCEDSDCYGSKFYTVYCQLFFDLLLLPFSFVQTFNSISR